MMKSCIAAFFGLALFCGAAFAAEDKMTVWFDAGGSPASLTRRCSRTERSRPRTTSALRLSSSIRTGTLRR